MRTVTRLDRHNDVTEREHTADDTAREEALSWLRSQLRWERTLEELRSSEERSTAKQAA
jgi:hypothetical protein